MKFLELFSGTGRISTRVRQEGIEAITIDFDESNNPDLCEDVYTLNLERFCKDNDIGFIWASPCCVSYSLASHGLHRASGGFALSGYAKDCDYWNNIFLDKLNALGIPYIIENPRGHFRNVFKDKFKYRTTTTYSAYGTPYMKPTDLFSNIDISDKIRKPNYKKCPIQMDWVHNLKGTVGRSYIPDELLNDIVQIVKRELK